jgi:TolB protein
MTDERDLLEAAARTIDPPHDVMEGLVRRRDRKRRNRRVGSAAVAIVVTAAVAVVLAQAFSAGRTRPANTTVTPVPRSNGRIAFVSPGESRPSDRIYTVAPDGTDLRLLADVHAEYPDWSPDGSTVAFDDGSIIAIRDWSNARGHVFTMRADGTGLRQVTSGSGAEFTPDWSPDGTHVAVSAKGQEGLPAGIFLLDPTTGAMHPVTANPYPGYMDKEPAFSPDGTRIVFVRDRQLVEAGASRNLSALFVVNVDGTGLRRLTPWHMEAGSARTPSFSPDGSTIVFASGEVVPPPGDRFAQIFVIGADGTGLRQLTVGTTTASFWQSWSPDGTRIVFTRYVSPNGSFELFTMDADGSDKAELTPTTFTEQNEADWGTHL